MKVDEQSRNSHSTNYNTNRYVWFTMMMNLIVILICQWMTCGRFHLRLLPYRVPMCMQRKWSDWKFFLDEHYIVSETRIVSNNPLLIKLSIYFVQHPFLCITYRENLNSIFPSYHVFGFRKQTNSPLSVGKQYSEEVVFTIYSSLPESVPFKNDSHELTNLSIRSLFILEKEFIRDLF